MADNTLKVRLQSAYKSSADWNTLNPVLKNGEVGFVSSPASMYGWYKIGNGTSTWNQLPYSTYRPLNNGDFDTINVTDETAGDLIVTGAARFLNTIQGTAASAVNATSATSAAKLTTNAGGAGTPVYFSNGVPTNCTLSSIYVGRATADESGNNIKATYASSISMDNHTLTLKNKNGASLATVDLHFDDLKSLIHKKYESTSYYATAADWTNSTWYFMSVKPDSWYKPWRVKFKVHSYCPNYANLDSYTWATYTGRADAIAYCNWNERYDSAHYYLPYYPLKKAGFDAGYGHAIGVSILYGSGYTTSSYYRTFEIDYYECENCTVTILDTPVKWSSWTGTGTTNYGSLNAPNAVDRGLQETGDANTVTENRISYFPGKTGTKGIWGSSLFMENANGTYEDICTAADGTVTSSNRTTATTKIANTTGFKIGGTIWYTNTTYAANTNISGNAVVYSSISIFDSRYAFNTTLTANSLTPYKEVYLVGTIHDDNLFYLDTVWWTQTPTDTSKIYILVGACFDSTTSNCRVTLYEQNIWYYYDGTMLREYVHKAKNADVADLATYAISAGAAPIPGVDRGLNVVSSKIGHVTSLTASANISGTANVSGWGQTATVAVPSIDAYGHTTACKTKTITMPSSTGLATTAYVNERVANAVHFKGGFDPNNADALKPPLKEIGDMYVATVDNAGTSTFYGLALESGDSIIFQSTVAAGTNPTSANFIGVEKTVSVENKGPTLSWGNTSTVGVVEGVNLTVKMPANPNTNTTYIIDKTTSGVTSAYVGLHADGASTWSSTTNLATSAFVNPLINALTEGTSQASTADYIITSYVGAGTPTTTYHRRKASLVSVGYASSAGAAPYPVTDADRGLSLVSKKIGHANSYTATANISGNTSTTMLFGGSFAVPYFSIDAYGHATAVGQKTFTLPGNPNTDRLQGMNKDNSTKYYPTGTTVSSNSTAMAIFSESIYNQGTTATAPDIVSTAVNTKIANALLTGAGTAAKDAGSSANPRYFPALWKMDTGRTIKDGDIVTFKVPVAGHDYGVWLSADNGANYYAIACNGTGRLTTHFPVNTYVSCIFETAGSVASVFASTGSNARITASGGCWRIINYYDSNSNDTGHYLRRIYPNIKAGSNKIFPYTIILQKPDGKWESLVLSSTTAASKAANTNGFLLNNALLMYANTTYNADGNVGTYNIWSMHSGLIDHRYSFNTENNATNGTTGYKPVYLVGTIGTDGLFYLNTTKWWAQDLPAAGAGTEGTIYWYIGDAYDYYRLTFVDTQKIYIYSNGRIREYSDFAQYAANAASLGGVSSTSFGTALGTSGNLVTLKNSDGTTVSTVTVPFATNASQLGGSAASTYLQGNDIIGSSGVVVTPGTGAATVSADLRTTTKLGAAGATAAATETTKIYAVQMDSNGDLAVKVPWTDSQDIPITGAEKGLTVTSKKVGHATTITAGNVGPDGNKSPSHGGTFVVPYIAYDAYGHSTAVANRTITLPNDTDTKNTAGSTNSDSKLFLIGATSQAANPQTYSDSEVYTTNGTLTTNKVQVGGTAVTLEFNSTTKSLDFVFA